MTEDKKMSQWHSERDKNRKALTMPMINIVKQMQNDGWKIRFYDVTRLTYFQHTTGRGIGRTTEKESTFRASTVIALLARGIIREERYTRDGAHMFVLTEKGRKMVL